jgi:hypothetical protein
MIHWKKEGEVIRQGISIYPPKDSHSAGGCLRIGNRLWRVRYSKFTKKWNFGYDKVNPNALREWEATHGFKHD